MMKKYESREETIRELKIFTRSIFEEVIRQKKSYRFLDNIIKYEEVEERFLEYFNLQELSDNKKINIQLMTHFINKSIFTFEFTVIVKFINCEGEKFFLTDILEYTYRISNNKLIITDYVLKDTTKRLKSKNIVIDDFNNLIDDLLKDLNKDNRLGIS